VNLQIEGIAMDPEADQGVGSLSSMECMHLDQEQNATQATQVTLCRAELILKKWCWISCVNLLCLQ
jgi:hypothetical protein